eukprot:3335107-Amphidinium_carterae.1
MVGPTIYDWQRLKRVGRYLKGKPRAMFVFGPQSADSLRQEFCSEVYVDSDHAGCLITRRSTTGLVVKYGDH